MVYKQGVSDGLDDGHKHDNDNNENHNFDGDHNDDYKGQGGWWLW